MKKYSVKFGYYPEKLDIDIGDISISTLTDLEEKVVKINNNEQTYNGWLYAPQATSQAFGISTSEVIKFPYSHRVFGLPKTHKINHKNCNDLGHLDFLIWTLSFSIGMRLTTTEAGFLDNTPIQRGKLVDFCIFDRQKSSLINAIQLSEIFWEKYRDNKKMTARITAIIHALFMAQNPRLLEYEKILMLYTAVDACYACLQEIRNEKAKTHAERIHWICCQIQINTPDWGQIADDCNGSELSFVRNDAIHEALFFDKPLGFCIYGGNDLISKSSKNIALEMQGLVCRILVWILTGDNPYIQTPVNTRQIYDLNI